MRFPWNGSGGRGERVEISDGWCLRSSHGLTSLIVTDNIDINSLSDAGARRLQSGFASLLETVEHPLTITVRRRRLERMVTAGVSTADVAMWSWMDLELREYPAWQQRVVLANTVAGSNAADLDHVTKATTRALRAGGVGARLMTGEELGNAVAEYLGEWTEVWDHSERDGLCAGAVRLGRFPGMAVTSGWLSAVLGAACDCDIQIRFEPLEMRQAVGTLQRRLREHRSQQLVNAHRHDVSDPFADAAVDNVEGLRARLAYGESRPLAVSVTAMARGAGHSELQGALRTLQRALVQVGAVPTPMHFRQGAAVTSTATYGAVPCVEGKLITADAGATLTPWVQDGVIEPGGYVLGRATKSRLPVMLDPFNAEVRPNANVGVFAASGQGKSFAVSVLILEAARAGRGAIILDPEGEYRRVVETLGGQYIDLERGNTGFNILDTSDGDFEGATERFVELSDLLTDGALGASGRGALNASVRILVEEATRAGRRLTLEECVAVIGGRFEQVAVPLRRLLSSKYRSLFDSGNAAIDAPVCALSMRGLPEDLVAPLTYVTAQWIWKRVTADPRPRHIVFDEVGALSAHAALRRLLVQLARRCRKYSASLVVATQNVEDLIGTAEGGVVATNCATVLLGGHRRIETARMEAVFGLNEAQRTALEVAPRGRFLLVGGEKRLEVDVSAPPGYRKLIGGGA